MNLLNQIEIAASRIQEHIFETSLEKCHFLSEWIQGEVYLKHEHTQRTGSFKIRGALNKLLSLSGIEQKKGVVCASAGNHGIGVALAAHILNIPATIFLPQNVDPLRLKKIQNYSAEIQQVNGDCLVAEQAARAYSEQNQKIYVSPYNDIDVIAGQGTLGLELHKQLPHFDACYVSVGGGGLISGIGAALHELCPDTSIVGCSPENSSVMAESIQKGFVVPDKGLKTLSDSTAGDIETESITLKFCQEWVERFTLVTENEIKNSMRLIAEYEGWMIEGAAAVPVAALIKDKEKCKGQKVIVLLCGRNINIETFTQVIHEDI